MRGWLGRLASGLAVASLVLAEGCGNFFVYPGSGSSGSSGSGGTGGSLDGDYVYVANQTTNSIAGFAVGSGSLTAISGSPYGISVTPTALAVNPANTILFVGTAGLIYAFSIGTGGALSVLNGGSPVGLSDVVAMCVSPDGQWLFALDGNGVTLDEFQINQTTGLLTAVTGASYLIQNAVVVPRDVKITPNGDYVILALGTAGELVYAFDTTSGGLTSTQQLAVSSTTSDNALAVGPSSDYLYIARSGTNGGLAVYTIGANGALSSVQGSPYAAGTQPYSVAVDIAGANVYVANRGDNTVSGYGISSTNGTLTALSGSPYTSGTAPSALLAERSGGYLLAVGNGGSPDLTMYAFDTATAGKLDLSTSVASGTDPAGSIAIAGTH